MAKRSVTALDRSMTKALEALEESYSEQLDMVSGAVEQALSDVLALHGTAITNAHYGVDVDDRVKARLCAEVTG
jgi:predicted TIM-barrel enzyme